MNVVYVVNVESGFGGLKICYVNFWAVLGKTAYITYLKWSFWRFNVHNVHTYTREVDFWVKIAFLSVLMHIMYVYMELNQKYLLCTAFEVYVGVR